MSSSSCGRGEEAGRQVECLTRLGGEAGGGGGCGHCAQARHRGYTIDTQSPHCQRDQSNSGPNIPTCGNSSCSSFRLFSSMRLCRSIS